MELKAIFLHDKTKILTKNYTKIELKDLYERDVTIDEVLIGITIKDDKIFLHKELKLNSSEDLIYVTYRFIAGKDHKISVYLIKNNEDITDDDVLRIEVYNKHILADKFTLGLKETADYLCLPIEKAKEICIHIA